MWNFLLFVGSKLPASGGPVWFPSPFHLCFNKLQKLEDALVKQMLTAADRAEQAEQEDRTNMAEVAGWADGADMADPFQLLEYQMVKEGGQI